MCYLVLVIEKSPLFDRIYPAQRHGRALGILAPSRRIELSKLHDPRHLREMIGKLRSVAAVDYDQVGFQFGEFALDRGVQFRLVEGSHRQ